MVVSEIVEAAGLIEADMHRAAGGVISIIEDELVERAELTRRGKQNDVTLFERQVGSPRVARRDVVRRHRDRIAELERELAVDRIGERIIAVDCGAVDLLFDVAGQLVQAAIAGPHDGRGDLDVGLDRRGVTGLDFDLAGRANLLLGHAAVDGRMRRTAHLVGREHNAYRFGLRVGRADGRELRDIADGRARNADRRGENDHVARRGDHAIGDLGIDRGLTLMRPEIGA